MCQSHPANFWEVAGSEIEDWDRAPVGWTGAWVHKFLKWYRRKGRSKKGGAFRQCRRKQSLQAPHKKSTMSFNGFSSADAFHRIAFGGSQGMAGDGHPSDDQCCQQGDDEKPKLQINSIGKAVEPGADGKVADGQCNH